jgi:hypothetical protein
MKNSWTARLAELPRFSVRGWFLLAGAVFFLFQHYGPERLVALQLLEIVPWEDRLLCAVAWFTASLVLLSLVMVILGKLIFLTTGYRGITRQMGLTASSQEKPSGWELGIAGKIPFVSASLEWTGADFIHADLDPKGRELLSATHRGWSPHPRRCIVFEDFFGFSKACCNDVDDSSSEVLVYPKSRRLEPMVDAPKLLSASDQGHAAGKSEGDLTESREYIQGEPMRHMLWRIAARTGGQKRYVRVPETAGEQYFRVIFVPSRDDEEAAQFADFLLRENPWGSCWLFSVAGGKDWSPDAFPEARKALARSANDFHDLLEAEWTPNSSDACVYLSAVDPRLPKKFAQNLDPAKSLFLLSGTDHSGMVVADLAAQGFIATNVQMID